MVLAPAQWRYLLIEGSLGGLGLRLGALSSQSLQGPDSPRSGTQSDHVEVMMDPNQPVSSSLATAFTELMQRGDSTISWDDVTHIIVSRGPGSYTGLRALLAFIYGIHGADQLQQPAAKRHWIGVSSLAMIMASYCQGSPAVAPKTYQRGVFMVQGHHKGYFGWCEPVSQAFKDNQTPSCGTAGAEIDNEDNEIDVLEFHGLRYCTVSATVISADSVELAHDPKRVNPTSQPDSPHFNSLALTDLAWIPQHLPQPARKARAAVSPSSPVNAYLMIQTAKMPQAHYLSLETMAIQTLDVTTATRASLAGMSHLVSHGHEGTAPLCSAAPPAAVYLRSHYGKAHSSSSPRGKDHQHQAPPTPIPPYETA